MKPGDMLFIPPMWLHATKSGKEPSISVNVFWRDQPEESYDKGKDIYGNKDLAAYLSGRTKVQEIMNELN
ncbi:hypothetical protein CANCADRAFT_31956, partial [Tortispora caseinolytica NRRL Y-17796]